jgi:hypothetical protein
MYACVLETGCGFFGGVCTPSSTTAHLRNPPPLSLTIRELIPANVGRSKSDRGSRARRFRKSTTSYTRCSPRL